MSRPIVTHHYGAYLLRGDLIQRDYDFPRAAESLGWSLQRVQLRHGEPVHLARRGRAKGDCEHRGTDGTVSCPDCGLAEGDFIRSAAEYLDHYSGY